VIHSSIIPTRLVPARRSEDASLGNAPIILDLRFSSLIESFLYIRGSFSPPVVLGSNTVIQQSWNKSFDSICCPGKTSNFEFICTFLKSAWIKKRTLKHLGDLFILLLREFPENRSNEVDMTHLPAGTRKDMASGCLYPLVSVRDDKVDLVQSSLLQLRENIFSG